MSRHDEDGRPTVKPTTTATKTLDGGHGRLMTISRRYDND